MKNLISFISFLLMISLYSCQEKSHNKYTHTNQTEVKAKSLDFESFAGPGIGIKKYDTPENIAKYKDYIRRKNSRLTFEQWLNLQYKREVIANQGPILKPQGDETDYKTLLDPLIHNIKEFIDSSVSLVERSVQSYNLINRYKSLTQKEKEKEDAVRSVGFSTANILLQESLKSLKKYTHTNQTEVKAKPLDKTFGETGIITNRYDTPANRSNYKAFLKVKNTNITFNQWVFLKYYQNIPDNNFHLEKFVDEVKYRAPDDLINLQVEAIKDRIKLKTPEMILEELRAIDGYKTEKERERERNLEILTSGDGNLKDLKKSYTPEEDI